jgi:tRNA(Ser,Leu) C12 N-acetylase TAN1
LDKLYNFSGEHNLAKKDEPALENDEDTLDIKQIKNRFDMLDRRLDNIDSIVSAVAERVMKQPITFYVTCSRCGHKIEIGIIGTEKLGR